MKFDWYNVVVAYAWCAAAGMEIYAVVTWSLQKIWIGAVWGAWILTAFLVSLVIWDFVTSIFKKYGRTKT